jgi:isopenicillin-N N-acyltransferase-like protein
MVTAMISTLGQDTPRGVIPPAQPAPLAPRLEITDVEGSGFDAGVSYGEAQMASIAEHLGSVLARARSKKGYSEGDLFDRARLFRPHVRDQVPDLAAEIDGIAAGAGLPTEAAWLLQLRAEVFRVDPHHLPSECTSFGVAPGSTRAGTIAGQNADLAPFYQEVLVLLRRSIPGKPRLLTLTPAGQVGWHGMNTAGVAVFANFLYSGGWRPGLPRYLFTRVALELQTARAAAQRLIEAYRGSSRNLLLADETEVLDLELAVDDWGIDEAVDDVVVHANHHVTRIDPLEQASEDYLKNSHARHRTMWDLVTGSGPPFDVSRAAEVLRNRDQLPDPLCRTAEDHTEGDDTITVASTIADVANRRLWIAVGPPHVGTYHEYAV